MTNKIYLESLGCSKNLVDSEVMLGLLSEGDCEIVDLPEKAEIIIINTCSFVEDAVKEAIETIYSLACEKDEGACEYLIVCGCLPQRYGRELLKEMPEVDLFLGTGEFQNISSHIDKMINGQVNERMLNSSGTFLMNDKTPRALISPGSSSYIKIAEGCSHKCTYCTIPSIRGDYQQRTHISVLNEAIKLAEQGIEEINLVAQDTSRFKGLPVLLKKMAKIDGLKWIRLLYCHPLNMSDDLIKVIAAEKKVCKYIDIPLQHISDSVLKRMGRRINREQTENLILKMNDNIPGIAFRTTMIVGFPGETDKDFMELMQFVKETQFDSLGAFIYSDEDGTPASRLKNKVDAKVKKERFRELMKLQAGISRKKNSLKKGSQMEVLVEGISANEKYLLQGRTEFQAPEVDGVVYLTDNVPIGSFVKLKITHSLTYDLVGKVL
jgi:ribosomal protein S12 methylthiotransferase